MAVNEKIRHLLVIGLPRSGTSYLQQLLNAMDGIFVSYESIYQPFINDNTVPSLHAYYYEVIKQHHHLTGLREAELADFTPGIKSLSFLSAYKYFGDKAIYQHTPEYQNKLQKAVDSKILDKVIFIVRDPRDRMLSFFEWMEKRDRIYKNTVRKDEGLLDDAIVKESEKWNEFVADANTMCQQYPKGLLIKYEDLVLPDTDCFSKMMAHLEIEPSQEEVTYYRKSISNMSVNKWKNKMDAATLQQIEALCGENLKALAYELSAS